MAGGQDRDAQHDGARADEERDVDASGDDQPARDVGRQAAADEPHEAVGGRGDRALDRGTVITAWVVSVLFTPMKIPDTITARISTARSVVQTAMTSTTTANTARLTYMVLAMPNRSCSRGAPNTAKIATRMPQPVNTRPSLIGLRSIGNGA